MNEFAIVIPCYNRTETLKTLLESLDQAYYNRKIDIVFSIDYSGSEAVKELASQFEWKYGEKKIIEHENNIGLRKNIIFCGDQTRDYNAVIVLEDDLLVSPMFFVYALKSYEFYKDDSNIAGISLYAYSQSESGHPFYPITNGYSTYFIQWTSSWGQMWTKSQWDGFRTWYNNNGDDLSNAPIPDYVKQWKESWKKYNIAYIVETNKYFVYPTESYSTPRPAKGIHSGREACFTPYNVPLCEKRFRDYLFQPFAGSIKYDSFFELCDYSISLDGVEEKVDFSFYGEKSKANLKHDFYITASKNPSMEPLKTWGLLELPLEVNVINNRVGDKIFLYKVSSFVESKFTAHEKQMLNLKLLGRESFLLLIDDYYRRIKQAILKRGGGYNPLVSIVTITYNRADLIHRCIESIQRQTYKNYEHIIVDGNSDDNTEEVVRGYNDPHIKFVKLNNRGPQIQLKAGGELAKGKYITFLDDDDEYLPEKIEKQVSLFETEPQEVGMVYCWMSYFDVEHPNQIISIHNPQIRGFAGNIAVSEPIVCGTPTLMVRKEIFDAVGGSYNDSIGYVGSDWELAARICQICNVDYLSESLVKVYVNHGHARLSTDFYGEKARKGILFHNHFLKEFAPVFIKHPEYAKKHYYLLIRCHSRLKERKEAFSWYKKYLALKPGWKGALSSLKVIIIGY